MKYLRSHLAPLSASSTRIGTSVLGFALLLGATAVAPACSSGPSSAELDDIELAASSTNQPLALSDPSIPLAIELTDDPDPMLEGLSPSVDALTAGMWSTVQSWPLNGLHAVLLPNGRVLTYGTPAGNAATQDGRTLDVWDPARGFGAASHTTSVDAQRVNSFCSSAAFLSDGRLLISGGNSPRDSSLFATGSGVVEKSPFPMASDRWYGSLITLADGRFVMLGGSRPYDALRAYQDPAGAIANGSVSMVPELYEPTTGFRSLFGANSREAFGPDFHRYWYPRAWATPNGEVFGISSDKMWYLDTSGDGSVRVVGNFKTGVSATTTPNVGPTSSAAMFAPGRILQVGGNGYHDGHNTPSSSLATIVDINGSAPVLQETSAMRFARQWPSLTVLPSGTVVVTGGTRSSNNGGPDAVYAAELWDPNTSEWTLGANASVIRVYHSAAILMPNGTVLSTGGGAPGPVNNLNAEVYYPPYLFRSSGAGGVELASRPRVTQASSLSAAYGESLQFELADSTPIDKAVLIGASSVTHSFNTFQRRMELPLLQENGRVAVQMPASGSEAPPGYYLVFFLDASGVPSKGIMLGLGEGVAPPPSVPKLPRTRDVTLLSANQPSSAISVDAQALGVLKALSTSPTEAELLPTRYFVRDGLADAQCVSFESVAAPGRFLRHYSYRLRLEANNGAAIFRSDATFCPEPGLSGEGFSFRSQNFPDRMIRHKNGELWIEPVTTTGTFSADATFTVRPVALPNIPKVAAPIVYAGETASYAPLVSAPGAQFTWSFGDGSGSSGSSPATSHTYHEPGLYLATLTVRLTDGREVGTTFIQAVRSTMDGGPARSSSQLALTEGPEGTRVWTIDADNDRLTSLGGQQFTLQSEVAVGHGPRSVAVAPNGEIWVTLREDAAIAVVDPTALIVVRTIPLPAGSRPYGLVFAPDGARAYVTLAALGQVAELDGETGAWLDSAAVGGSPRGLAISGDGGRLFVSSFISPPVPGEATGAPNTSRARGELVAFDLPSLLNRRVIELAHSTEVDSSVSGRGVPNYLAAPAIAPDGLSAWIPSKQDNIARGTFRDGLNLDFQNTVRAIASRVLLSSETEERAMRVDLDNSSVASAAIFHPSGAYLFVALETSREVAVVNPHLGTELFRIQVGRAPQALATSGDGTKLFVKNFMDRSLSVIDLEPLTSYGEFKTTHFSTQSTVSAEKLSPQVFLGKQLFYDAKDPRLARDGYMSCASCHAEGGDDGRVWDLTGFGEGLRNTIPLEGHAGASRGRLHWSGNFDEVQDFEQQIRALAGGTGLMTDAVYLSGTVREPLGTLKAGLSSDLDALAAYLTSLTLAPPSPYREEGELTEAALRGRGLFVIQGCTDCHYGASFAREEQNELIDIGTLTAASGQRLFGPLSGFDVPSLLGAWNSAPYLHDGSALTLTAAIASHDAVELNPSELEDVADFVRQIDAREAALNQRGCDDGIRNRDESDVDCGGSCEPCRDGEACHGDGDCQSRSCFSGVCAAAPTCTDGVKNQNESDVDCGGMCADCASGKVCAAPGDCVSNVCTNGFCAAAPTCTDGLKNQNESDVDCGGVCADCANGKVCAASGDCVSNICTGNRCVAAPTCTDGLKNQNESDVDCGGVCADCANGKVCAAPGDCVSNICTSNRCVAPSSRVSATIKLQSDWSEGYCADITVKNTSAVTLNTWTVQLSLNQSTVNNFWSSHWSGTGSNRAITPMSWNATLAPNASTVIGYCANKVGSSWRPSIISAQ